MLWCLGMYASGSTWAFNAAMKVAAVVVPRTPVVGRFVTRHDELEFLDDPMRLPIVKSHDTDAAAAACWRLGLIPCWHRSAIRVTALRR